MKKLMIICCVILLALTLTGVSFAVDDEDSEVVKRHKEWIGKVMSAQRGNAGNANIEIKEIENGFLKKVEEPWVTEAKRQLCEMLDIKENKIKDVAYKVLWVARTSSIPPSTYTTYTIGLVYDGNTYIFSATTGSSGTGGEQLGSVEFTGEVFPTQYDAKGNLILDKIPLGDEDILPLEDLQRGGELNPEALKPILRDEGIPQQDELVQRKIIEEKVLEQANDPMFTGQMADEPEEQPLPVNGQH